MQVRRDRRDKCRPCEESAGSRGGSANRCGRGPFPRRARSATLRVPRCRKSWWSRTPPAPVPSCGARSSPRTASADAEVVEAVSGFDALRLLPRGPYDLVITDINMPDINGLELVQFMRKSELHRATPILLISTQSSERDRERGLRLGANGYLAKPFGPQALVAEAYRHLGARGRSSGWLSRAIARAKSSSPRRRRSSRPSRAICLRSTRRCAKARPIRRSSTSPSAPFTR